MLLRAFRTSLVLVPLLTLGAGSAVAADAGPTIAVVATVAPSDTVNPFLPDDRGISDCVSALPKPGCGSEERGGWRQGLILLGLVGGLSIIGWRIIAGVRTGGTRPNPAEPNRAAPNRAEPNPATTADDSTTSAP